MKTGKRFRSLIAMGVVALVLGGVFGVGSKLTPTFAEQPVEFCAPATVPIGTAPLNTLSPAANCQFVNGITTVPQGDYFTKTIVGPIGAAITSCTGAAGTADINGSNNWVCVPGAMPALGAPVLPNPATGLIPAVPIPAGGVNAVTFICNSTFPPAPPPGPATPGACTPTMPMGTITVSSTTQGVLTQTIAGSAGTGLLAPVTVTPGVTFVAEAAAAPAEACSTSAPTTGTGAGTGTTCTLTFAAAPPAGTTLAKTVTAPLGATITAATANAPWTFAPNPIPAAGVATVTFTCGAVAPATCPLSPGTVTISSPIAGPLGETFSLNGGAPIIAAPVPAVAFVAFAFTSVSDQVGCANSNTATSIIFPTNVNGLAQPASTASVGLTLVPPSYAGTSSIATTAGGFFPFASAVECASVIQATGAGGVVSNTVPGGTVTYSISNPLSGNPFGTNSVFSPVVQILESNGLTTSINCGSAQGNISCQGAVAGAGATVTPNPALVVHVGFVPGATFSFIGAGSPVFTLTDTYNEYPALGALTATATTTINIIPPVYSLSLTPNPGTIAASPTGVTASSTTTITATLYHYASYGCVPVSGSTIYVVCASGSSFLPGGTPGVVPIGQTAPISLLLQTGAEPGNIEFYVANGAGAYFTGLGSAAGSAGTVITVHCGTTPGTVPSIIIPTTSILPSFSFTSCTSASVTLAAQTVGVVTVVANYTGDYTGATAQASTTVNVSAAAATVTLTRGCNEVVINAAAGMTAQQVLALASPTSNVVSIWQFNNSLHAFQALYFSTAGAPTDISSVGTGSQSVFYCVSGNTTVTTGF